VIFGNDPFLYPSLTAETQAFIRVAYGVLMLLTLVAALPHARRYFFSERWGGFTESSPFTDAIQNPAAVTVVLAIWIAATVGLIAGRLVIWSGAINLACCYYFFNRLRWRSVSRGMGAPGFIALWLAAAVFVLELTARRAPPLRGLALFTLQVDFAAIMLSAGLYKLVAGYRHQHGMELGMVNPEWGYWPSFWKAWRPSHPMFRFFDEMAWSTEVACGLLMMIPATRFIGAMGMLLSFVFIASQIRLGFLAEMVMVCCLLFASAGTAVDGWIVAAWSQLGAGTAVTGEPLPLSAQQVLSVAFWVYLALLPLARAGMFYNQLRHRRWPPVIQRALDAYTNTFGLILWRVFTADVVNFFVRVWEQPPGGVRRLLSDFRLTGPSRFSQVAECIALTSVFTTLKYYPGNRALFESRLTRYARTLPHRPDAQLIFEWVYIAPRDVRFDYVPIAEFTIGPGGAAVTETVLSHEVSVRGVPEFSPVHEGARPGSYAPSAR
jgi:hypothetical protein